jgi:aconitase A
VLRNCDGKKVSEIDIQRLANWNAKDPIKEEIPFVVARIVLQDFTGVPLLVDLAAMRAAVAKVNRDPKVIEPLVPVDLVVDHSVQVDFAGSPEALSLNLDMEFKRNRERYQFLKWGQQAFKTFGVVPPGIGIVHQVNLEYLAKGVLNAKTDRGEIFYPDTLVGTDSHTTMINGLGIVGWGVGGIEAEAGMLGQPVYFLTPEVVGVHMSGRLREGVTATDLALHLTQLLRARKVVGKFVEFYGEGAASLPLFDRATIGNMAPEYGATMGFFPVDAESVNYLHLTGRSEKACERFENYFKAQGMFGMPLKGEVDYSVNVELDLASVEPSVSGPKRPQDRINLPELKQTFEALFEKPLTEGGYGKKTSDLSLRVPVHINGSTPAAGIQMPSTDTNANHPEEGLSKNEAELIQNRPTPGNPVFRASPSRPTDTEIGHGSVLIAAITSCTNTSNPNVMLGAGLLAKKAVERGLKVNPTVKTSMAPGSRVVTDYLAKTGLQSYLDQLGFKEPPFFENFSMEVAGMEEIRDARPLGIFGDSVTTDHISPAGAIKPTSPAGKYLVARGVQPIDFNSYGSRRGNDRVMTRGTFANVRIKNLMVPGVEGGVTIHHPSGEQMSIFDASIRYQKEKTPLIIIAGHEYGTGSSRDWAAKGSRLLGVKAVIAASFERIHRSNLVGMGVLPLQFHEGVTGQTLHLDGSETFSLLGIDRNLKPRQAVDLEIKRKDGKREIVPLVLRIDTPIEVDYYKNGGILPFVLREILRAQK